jgi:hypothetical protein
MWVEVYYEKWLLKLVNNLQTPTIDNFLTIVFRSRLHFYSQVTITKMKRLSLQYHKELALMCKEKAS